VKRVWLFYLSNSKYGGFVSHTVHMARSLERRGWEARIVKVGARTESRMRPFLEDREYQNVSLEDAVMLARKDQAHITCVVWKHYGEEAEALLRAGAGLTLHDPTEFAPDLLDLLRTERIETTVIRPANMLSLADEGIQAQLIPQPYVPYGGLDLGQQRQNAVALSRVDWDKHTELIVEANAQLPPEKRVEIWGAENRLFTFHTLEERWPKWREQYRGPFDGGRAAVQLAATHHYMVDMSAIKGDGGGSQYTFLEALEAGAQLVLNEAWLRDDDHTMEQVALWVRTSDQLWAQLLERQRVPDVGSAVESLLADHAPDRTVPPYIGYWARVRERAGLQFLLREAAA